LDALVEATNVIIDILRNILDILDLLDAPKSARCPQSARDGLLAGGANTCLPARPARSICRRVIHILLHSVLVALPVIPQPVLLALPVLLHLVEVRELVRPLSCLFVDEDPAVLILVPARDPRGRDLRWVGLRAAADEVVDEGAKE